MSYSAPLPILSTHHAAPSLLPLPLLSSPTSSLFILHPSLAQGKGVVELVEVVLLHRWDLDPGGRSLETQVVEEASAASRDPTVEHSSKSSSALASTPTPTISSTCALLVEHELFVDRAFVVAPMRAWTCSWERARRRAASRILHRKAVRGCCGRC